MRAIFIACLGLPGWVGCGGLVVQPPSTDASTGTVVPEAGEGDGAGAIGSTTAPDCPGCTFPEAGAAPCPAVPSIKIVYPPDQALLPPNLGTLSVQWVPYGPPFARFEVAFTQSAQSPVTDWRIVTSCSAQTTDQLDAGSGGCEITVDPTSWGQIAGANRGGEPVAISVRGTTDGACASTSSDTIHVSFAEQDVAGTYFYWRSQSEKLGLSGQVWGQAFGDLAASPGRDLTTPTFAQPICAGCHSQSRDGSRMLVYPVDDTDPDYGGLEGSLIDLTPWPADAGVTLAAGQPPGSSVFAAGASAYLTSNGLPCQATSANPCPQEVDAALPAPVGVDAFSLWGGQDGAFEGEVTTGPSGGRPTMPDWSVDGKSVVYVEPTAVGGWDFGQRSDDDHVFGGSLYTAPYAGAGKFGAATPLVESGGENNYYPSYSPDAPASLIVFDRAPSDTTVSTLTGCTGTAPRAVCPNDSFANPAARLMLVDNSGRSATPVDLANANGSSTVVASALSNSYPRFAPFVQSYKGKKLYWITFSSTRDYALRVLNHKDGMYPCYPADSYEWPGSVHANLVDTSCQHPQLWMAPLRVDATGSVTSDPSGPAFWIPYQDGTSHNHLASWMWRPDGGSSCTCAAAGAPCGPSNGGCGCCSGSGLVCSGDGRCIQPVP